MRSSKWRRALAILCVMALVIVQFSGNGGVARVLAESDEPVSIELDNGDFEAGDSTNWELVGFSSVATDSWATNNTTYTLNLWLSDTDDTEGSASYTVSLTAGTYSFGFVISGAVASSGLSYKVVDASDNELIASTALSDTTGYNVWIDYTTAEFTLTEDTEVTFVLYGTVPGGYWGNLDNLTLTGTGSIVEAVDESVSIDLDNGDFETGDSTNWELVGFSSVATDSWATNNTTYTLNLWLDDDADTEGSASYTVGLTAGTYSFGFVISGAAASSGLSYKVVDASGDVLVASTALSDTTGYNVWIDYTTAGFTLTEDTDVTFVLSGTVPAGYWGNLDNLTLTGTGALSEEDTTVYDADINVTKVSGLSDDFVMGMDISSIISEFDSGVVYYDFDGNKIDNVTDFCQFLAEDCGITHVRVRVWNNPYDSDGNGYGGGNCDVDKAVEIAEACAVAGLSLLVDFHYSDFWADPSKYDAPKAWEDMTLAEKEVAIAEFTKDSLTKIAATGVDIDMVQIGNETTGGLCGETSIANMCTLFNAASAAIRDFDSDIRIVVHVTNPEKYRMTQWAGYLNAYNVDYDILATSYYVYWHGTLDNLIDQMETVKETYGKDVMVAETSYAYTLDDTDGHDNTVREGSNDTGMDYAFTVQGQADCIRDVIAAVSEAGGLGVFYWEPAWITVGDTTGLTGDEYDAQVEANKVLWEKYGSGWASSYAKDYDPDDAGVWYGGSAVDNQAMFDASGNALASLNVWNYVKTGAVSNTVTIDSIETVEETIYVNGTYTLPETITVTYNTGSVEESVTWDAIEVEEDIDVSSPGVYVIDGTVTLSKEVTDGDYEGCTAVDTTYTLTVKEANLITDADDAGFESGDNFTTVNASIPSTSDVYEGTYALHWWSESATTGSAIYDKEVTLDDGWYTFEVVTMGCGGDTVTLSVLDTEGNTLFEGDATTLQGWASDKSGWLTSSVTFCLSEETTVKLKISLGILDGGWGSVDNMYLHKHAFPVYDANDDQTHYVTCNDCGAVLAEAEPCDISYESNGDWKHRVSCELCGTLWDEEDCTIVVTDATAAASGGVKASVTMQCTVCGYTDTEYYSLDYVSSTGIELNVGETDNLEAEYEFSSEPEGINAVYSTAYSSSDEDVATVEADGTITAVGEGTADITYSVYATLTVNGEETTILLGSISGRVNVYASELDEDDTESEESESTETESTETENTESEDTETGDTEDIESEETGEIENTETEDTEYEDTESEDSEASGEEDAISEAASYNGSFADGALYFAYNVESADEYAYLAVEIVGENGAYIYAASNGEYYYITADGIVEVIDFLEDAITLEADTAYTVAVESSDDGIMIYFYDEDGNILLNYEIEGADLGDSYEATLITEGVTGTAVEPEVIAYAEETTEPTEPESSETETPSESESGSSEADKDNSGDSSTNPKTGDASPIVPIVVALLGCAAVVSAAKRRRA